MEVQQPLGELGDVGGREHVEAKESRGLDELSSDACNVDAAAGNGDREHRKKRRQVSKSCY